MSFRPLMFRPLLAGLIAVAAQFAHAQTPVPDVPRPNLPTPSQMPIPPAPAAAGTAWLLMDYASGRILAGNNIDEPLHPASLTKIMTAYVLAAEMTAGRVKADDEVLISENAWRSGGAGTDGSFSALAVGSRVKLSDIEMGLVVQSGNDAAIAIAEHVSGSEDAFAGLMNSYAQKLGMTASRFLNAHGLTAEGHTMSARDIAILSQALIRDYPEHYALSKIKEYTYNGIRQYNRNGLLWKDESVDGIKTGHTAAAGYCLAASAIRGGQRLISVVMGVEGSRNEAFRRREEGNLALLNWGFRHFETHTLYSPEQPLATPRLWKGEVAELPVGVATPVIATVPRGRYAELVASMDLPPQLVAPITKGQEIGRVRVKLGDEIVADQALIALSDAAEAGFVKRTWDGLMMWWESD